ncbi:hypothetical protein QR98_0028970 [Sarcoptes scabiei]|uniref:Uncharacterized protein n=1 Tax=Sarcoptes scabiei TaxID=52283 RepID=A0A132A0W7_SARSC|nr:hypothetical protein QR98_0028970 [Sarcoptes scabiei]
MTSNEDRNFRYGYYGKVGCGGIEEKKSIEILLREKPPDLLARLAQLSSRYSLSAQQRKQIWQLLLDVVKIDARISEVRVEIQRQIVNDIIDGLRLMGLIEENLPDLDQIERKIGEHSKILVVIYLFETRQLTSDLPKQLEKIEVQDLLTLSEVFIKEFVQPIGPNVLEDAYQLFKNFVCIYEKFVHGLANDDNVLHKHLVQKGIIKANDSHANSTMASTSILSIGSAQLSNSIVTKSNERKNLFHKQKIGSFRPLITWFMRFFSGIIHQNYIIRVLDKVVGCLINGSKPFYILISVSKALILYLRNRLLLLNTTEQLKNYLLSVSL